MPAGFLFDLEGTIYQGDTLLPGAREAIEHLTQGGIPFGFVTNATSRSRGMIVTRLAALGIAARPEQVMTSPRAAAKVVAAHGWQRVAPYLPAAALEDLAPLSLQGGVADMAGGLEARATAPPEAVIVGDLGARWSFSLLQEAFTYLRQGAALVACSRDRYFRDAQGLVLDAGPFVVALEYATGATALLAGKPSAAIFEAAVAALGVAPENRHDVVMIGDDLRTDVAGARDAGLTAWAVRTGKFAVEDVDRFGVRPDRILTNLGELATPGTR